MITTATDHGAIVRVVRLYVDGFNDCDIDKFKEAFHEDAWIFYTNAEGARRKYLRRDLFEDWAAPPNKHIAGRIVSVLQAGDIASVLLGFDNQADPAESWIDLHALLRVDGVWKITNKTATHHSRAGGA
jgi:ketosteroid isomerase-like protein